MFPARLGLYQRSFIVYLPVIHKFEKGGVACRHEDIYIEHIDGYLVPR